MSPLEWAGIVSTSLGILAAILTLTKGGPAGLKQGFIRAAKVVWWLLTPLHGFWTNARAQKALMGEFQKFEAERGMAAREGGAKVKAIAEAIKGLDERVTEIHRTMHREFSFNGGASIKDILVLLNADFRDRKREVPYPMFICDHRGQNQVVSQAYLNLHGLEHDTALLHLDWLQFIDSRDVPLYSQQFLEAAERRSSFGGRFRFADPTKGTWYVTARPLIVNPELKLLYLGVMRPADTAGEVLATSLCFDYSKAPY